MHLTPKEIDKLMLHNAGFLAQKRYARGIALNYVEAVALIATQLLEFIREGEAVADLMNKGKQILGTGDVMTGVTEMVQEVQVEGTFPDGTKLVTVHNPICREKGDAHLALYGSGLTKSTSAITIDNVVTHIPGENFVSEGEIVLNKDRKTVRLQVVNNGDRPIQVGSHYPFFETNKQLRFNREAAYGFRLNIPAGTAVRFEPGEAKEVELVEIDGQKIIHGGNNLIDGALSEKNKAEALQKVTNQSFLNNK